MASETPRSANRSVRFPSKQKGFGTSKSGSILVVSHEPSLRDTYAWLFRSEGHLSYGVDVDELCSTLKGSVFEVVVIDHTLSRYERKAAVQHVRQLAPKALTVALHKSGNDSGADLNMDSRQGAPIVLEAVNKLLNRNYRARGFSGV